MTPNKVVFYDFISSQVNALKYIKLWFISPYSTKSIWFWIDFCFGCSIGITCFLLPIASQFIYIVKLIVSGNGDVQSTAGLINTFTAELVVFTRLITLYLRRHSLAELIDQMSDKDFHNFVLPRYRTHFEKGIKKIKRIYMVLTTFSYFGLFIEIIVAPAFHGFQELPVKIDIIFFDYITLASQEYFIYAYIFMVLYKVALVLVYLAIQTLSWAFMLCAICHLDALNNSMENMKKLVADVKFERKCDDEKAFRYVLKTIIFHHQIILRFVKQIDKTFGEVMFFTLFLTSCIICTSSLQILSFDNRVQDIFSILWVGMLIAVVAVMFWTDCYFANSITYRSLQIPSEAFKCPWVSLSTTTQKDLIMFMANAQRPLQIYAAGLVPISLETFKQVMNWTYKGFAVMNQMRK